MSKVHTHLKVSVLTLLLFLPCVTYISALPSAMQEALESGIWNSRNVIDNSKSESRPSKRTFQFTHMSTLLPVLFIAGHENTQNALNSILMVLARDTVGIPKFRYGLCSF